MDWMTALLQAEQVAGTIGLVILIGAIIASLLICVWVLSS